MLLLAGKYDQNPFYYRRLVKFFKLAAYICKIFTHEFEVHFSIFPSDRQLLARQ
mgnify:FL=1